MCQLLGSTLDVLDSDFLRGQELLFSGDSFASIVNLGTIEASYGDVILIARQVENVGSIAAPNGHALIGTGAEVLMKPTGPERIFIQAVSANDDEGEEDHPLITNTGSITAVPS